MKKVLLAALALTALSAFAAPAIAGPRTNSPSFNAGSPVFNVRQSGCAGGCSATIINSPSYTSSVSKSNYKTIDKGTYYNNYNSYYGYGYYGGGKG